MSTVERDELVTTGRLVVTGFVMSNLDQKAGSLVFKNGKQRDCPLCAIHVDSEVDCVGINVVRTGDVWDTPHALN